MRLPDGDMSVRPDRMRDIRGEGDGRWGERISPASTQEKDVQPAKTTNSAPPMPARNTQPVRVKKLDPTHKLTPIKDSEPSKPKRPARRPKKHQSS
jgi:hypothetical protein